MIKGNQLKLFKEDHYEYDIDQKQPARGEDSLSPDVHAEKRHPVERRVPMDESSLISCVRPSVSVSHTVTTPISAAPAIMQALPQAAYSFVASTPIHPLGCFDRDTRPKPAR